MKNIECEERVMIDFDQYTKLVAAYVSIDPNFRILSIENIYLDDEELSLRKRHDVLRIRNTNGHLELTLKVKGIDGDIEINETPEKHPEIDKRLEKPFARYHEIARLKTNRIEANEKDYLVVIDQNMYNGIIDYDLEVEASSLEKAKSAIKDICQRFSLEYKNGYQSKISRALKTKKN